MGGGTGSGGATPITPRRLYSQYVPGLYAEVFTEGDERGTAPAVIYDNGNAPQSAVILLSEWTEKECAPTPVAVPERAWLIIEGTDPALATARYVETEKEAIAAMLAKPAKGKPQPYGYLPILIQRTMIPK